MGRATLTQQESMSKGRKLSLIVVWIRRLLSAFSPSPEDEAAREAEWSGPSVRPGAAEDNRRQRRYGLITGYQQVGN